MRAGFGLLTLMPGRVGGSETYVRGLLGGFAAGEGPEELVVLANAHVERAYAGTLGPGQSLHRVRSYRAGDGMATRALGMLAARLAPRVAARDVPGGLDVLHHPVTVPIPDLPGVPRVVTVHDLQHHELPELLPAAERRYRRWAYDGAARSADVVVTPSRHAADQLVERLGLDASKVVPIPHGIDHERFTADPQPAPQLDAVELPPRFVVFPANLWPHKNHERLVEALARTEDPGVALVLTGQDYGRLGDLRRLAREAGVGERVRHLGYLPAQTVPELYRRALGMVFPSLYEGFGFPVLEAMACGCPVASSSAGSIPEVCGDAALLFDPRDPSAIAAAIDRLAGDEALCERLREGGLRQAAGFTWAASARAHAGAYERALRG